MDRKYGNANIFSLSAFGFSLISLGVELVYSREAAGAALYGVLFAAILEIIGGMWNMANGESYLGGIVTTFGGWLLGYYFLMTQGRVLKLFTDISVATYMLGLIPIIIILAIPAIYLKKRILIFTFVALTGVVIFLGLQAITKVSVLGNWAGIFSFLSAIGILWLLAENVLETLHVRKVS